jgi:hypothetical protein
LDIREIVWDGMEWIDLAEGKDQWGALLNTIISLRVSYNFGKFLGSVKAGCFTRKVIWVATLCRLERAQLFGGTYRLHLQGGSVS